jgi:ribonucleotide reductase alpha subunit
MTLQDLQKMTLQDLQKANDLVSRIEAKKSEINLYESCKLASITFRKFNEKRTDYIEIEVNDEIPRGIIKKACIEHLRADLENLQNQFDKFLLFKNEDVLVNVS